VPNLPKLDLALQLTATLQRTAMRCNALQRAATRCKHAATHFNTLCQILQSQVVHCNKLQHSNTLQHTERAANTLQHAATRCNTLCQIVQS